MDMHMVIRWITYGYHMDVSWNHMDIIRISYGYHIDRYHMAFWWGGSSEQYLHGFPERKFIQKNFRGNGRGKRVVGEFLLSVGRFLNHWGWVKMGWVVK